MAIIIVKNKKLAPSAPVVSGGLSARPAKPSHGRILDAMCKAVVNLTPKGRVSWFLMASYTYYIHDLSILSDAYYDQLAKELLEDLFWREHPHQELITIESLEAGSLYNVKAAAYPLRTRGGAKQLLQSEWGTRIDIYKDCDEWERP